MKRREMAAWIIAIVAIVVAAIALASSSFRRVSEEAHALRFFISPTDQASFIGSIISPDGRRLAIAARDSSGKTLLWIRSLDSLGMQPLSGTENANFPFWSPDSRSIAFFAGGKLKRVDISGGPSQTLCDAGGGGGGAWNRDGVIIFAPDNGTVLYRVPASGGTATRTGSTPRAGRRRQGDGGKKAGDAQTCGRRASPAVARCRGVVAAPGYGVTTGA